MEIFLDPTVWAGLATLVVLEIVLGIDNLIFIAILSDKLPPEQRQRARVLGLSLAMLMRFVLLASISWIASLTTPLFSFLNFDISARDLIMLVGGAFLLLKGTLELHEKLEGHLGRKTGPVHYAGFWSVILQIVVLDAVFSLDAVITAVGMTDHLYVMMIAVCIAMCLMILASNRLMNFISNHPTVVILCLGFLLMIGFSLMLEGFDHHIPKGYLYAAIGFSVLIEAANQMARNNRKKNVAQIDPRTRLSQAVFGLMGIKSGSEFLQQELSPLSAGEADEKAFNPQERLMIQRVLQLSHQQVKEIMTPRHDLYWIDQESDLATIEAGIKDCPYSCLVVGRGSVDEPLGVVFKKDIADFLLKKGSLKELQSLIRQPIMIPVFMTALQTLDAFQKSRLHVAFVIDEFGALEGLITLTDVVEAIAGDMPEDHEEDDFRFKRMDDGSVVVNASLGLLDLQEILGDLDLPEGDYSTAAGIALNHLKRLPKAGDRFFLSGWIVVVTEMEGRRVSRLSFIRQQQDD